MKTKTQAIELEMNNHCEDWEWQDWLYDLEHNFLKPINPDMVFYITGRNMGWRNLDGYMCKRFEDAKDFCFGVFPDTCWTARFKLEAGRLYITLSHHDSPTGESYEVLKATTCDLCGEPCRLDNIHTDADGCEICPDCK